MSVQKNEIENILLAILNVIWFVKVYKKSALALGKFGKFDL